MLSFNKQKHATDDDACSRKNFADKAMFTKNHNVHSLCWARTHALIRTNMHFYTKLDARKREEKRRIIPTER